MTLYLGKRRVELITSAARTRRATSSPGCRTPTWCSRAISSSTSRPATAATRISPNGPATLERLGDFKAEALVPGRGDALEGRATVPRASRYARLPARHSTAGRSRRRPRAPLKECFDAATRGHAPEVRELRDLRALPAVQRLARLRRGPGHRPSGDLDRRARPRDVGGAAGMTSRGGQSRRPAAHPLRSRGSAPPTRLLKMPNGPSCPRPATTTRRFTSPLR